ncbi:hypothetical protein B0H12DRAFT_1090496 [Mycena haematopus]|nr:hypothetical protein B0H12DRAFT_1090496 [Mycena haematopus]
MYDKPMDGRPPDPEYATRPIDNAVSNYSSGKGHSVSKLYVAACCTIGEPAQRQPIARLSLVCIRLISD